MLTSALLALHALLPLPTPDLGALQNQLRASDARERREAIQGLAKLGGDEAWKSIMKALGDEEAMVADEAEWVLAQCTLPPILEELHGRDGLQARKALVGLRCAELLGRSTQPIDGDAAIKVLKAKDPRLRYWMLNSLLAAAQEDRIELRKEDAFFKAIDRVIGKDKDDGVRAMAFLIAAGTDPMTGSLLATSALAEGSRMSWPVRAAAVELLEGRNEDLHRSLLEAAMGDEHVSVRTRAVECARDRGDRYGAQLLVARLEVEQEERLTWHTVAALQAISGLKHGRDVRPWKDWVDGLAEDWRKKTGQAPTFRGEGASKAALVGLPILSRRVTFLVDFSGSLWQKRADGKTRKQVLDVEIRRALEALPEDCQFNLIPYTLDPIPWKKKLVPASKRNVASALDFFEGLQARGKGNVWDAVQLALTDPATDSIVILSDGAPSGGPHWNLTLMRRLLAEENRFRRVTFDAVVVDAKPWISGRWAEICADSGGRSLPVELK